jgi:hypothetical protein
MVDFSRESLVAAGGVDPWGLRDKLSAGSPDEIYLMARGFQQAAVRQGAAVALTTRGLHTTGDGYQVDGVTPIQVHAEVALAERQLGGGGEQLGRVAKLISDVAGDLTERTNSAVARVADLDGEVNAVVAKWNSWVRGHPDATAAEAAPVRSGYLAEAVGLVRQTGQQLRGSVADYETLLARTVKALSDLGYVSAPDQKRAPADAGGGSDWLTNIWRFFGGDLANFWTGGTAGMAYGAVGAGLLRIFRTGRWLVNPENPALFPTFNTGLVGRGLSAVGSRLPLLAKPAAWLQTPGATMAFRGLGVAGGTISTALDVKNLVEQGNPVDAFHREGAGYVADVAKTGFSASTTAFMLAPNPVTGAFVIGTGAVWAGAEIVDNWDDITETAGDAWDGAKSVASKLNPFD